MYEARCICFRSYCFINIFNLFGRERKCMEIERINENTVKFYISYIDIEDRGFEREEIWYDRERSEQLFWQMMDEVNYKEEFTVDGPLWIQVQALDKGLEIVVTKAQISKNGEELELPLNDETSIDISVEGKIESMIESKFGKNKKNHLKLQEDAENDSVKEENLSFIASFKEFEDMIQLSHYFQADTSDIKNKLYFFEDQYYLYLEFAKDTSDDDHQENLISQVFEFGDDTDITVHYLEEYGKVIFEDEVFEKTRTHFPAQL